MIWVYVLMVFLMVVAVVFFVAESLEVAREHRALIQQMEQRHAAERAMLDAWKREVRAHIAARRPIETKGNPIGPHSGRKE